MKNCKILTTLVLLVVLLVLVPVSKVFSQSDESPISQMGKTGDGIEWIDSWDEGFKKAKKEDKHVFLLVTAPTWCHWCKVLEKNALSEKDLIKKVNSEFIPVRILDTNESDMKKLNFEFAGFPTIAFLKPNQEFLFKFEGAVDKDTIIQNMDRVSNPKEFEKTFKNKLKDAGKNENDSIKYLENLLTWELYEWAADFSNELLKRSPKSKHTEKIKYYNILAYYNMEDYDTTLDLCDQFIVDHPKSEYYDAILQIINDIEYEQGY